MSLVNGDKSRAHRERKQNMKEPVHEHSLVSGLRPQTPCDEDDVNDSAEAQQAPKNCDGRDPVPRSACDRRQRQHDAEMNDGRRRKGVTGLRISSGDRHVGDEGHHDELQSDQGAIRRADDHVEVLPSA